MAIQVIPGRGLYIPEPSLGQGTPAATSISISASTHKVSMFGRVWSKDRAAKNISGVGLRLGALVSAGGSTFRVSLQDPSASAGQPAQPDGTVDQSWTSLVSALTANAWNRGTLDATRASVAHGTPLCVVCDFSAFAGSDSVGVSTLSASFAYNIHGAQVVLFNGTTWTVQDVPPNVVLEFDDGSFGTLDEGFVFSALNSHIFNQGTAVSDEYALEFAFPFPCQVGGAWVLLAVAGTTTTFNLVLYTGTTATATVAVDPLQLRSTAPRWLFVPFGAEVPIAANTTYRLAIQPTSANSVTAYSYDVAAAGHFQSHAGGTPFALATRLDLGAWAATTTTRRPFMGLRVSGFDDATGGGGGGTTQVFILEG